MSANDGQDQQKVDPKVEMLRSAGHDAAAAMIEAAGELEARRAAQKARDDAQRSVGPPGVPLSERPGIRLLPGHVFDGEREQEGRAILAALRASGMGQPHGSSPMFPGLNGGER